MNSTNPQQKRVEKNVVTFKIRPVTEVAKDFSLGLSILACAPLLLPIGLAFFLWPFQKCKCDLDTKTEVQ